MTDLSGLPGGEIVAEGLGDLSEGRETVPALVVAIAAARLRRLGIAVPHGVSTDAELRLYGALCREEPAGAYSRYNSLLRRIDSFARAMEREEGTALRAASAVNR